MGFLLGSVRSTHDIESAFGAFEAVRRKRCQRMIESSTETGKLMCGKKTMRGNITPEQFRKELGKRWNFIVKLDLKKHRDEAMRVFRELQYSSIGHRQGQGQGATGEEADATQAQPQDAEHSLTLNLMGKRRDASN